MQGQKSASVALLLVVGVISCLSSTSNAQLSNLPLITDLTGSGWTIKNGNGSISVGASVPVYALQALQDAKLVPNPLERYLMCHAAPVLGCNLCLH